METKGNGGDPKGRSLDAARRLFLPGCRSARNALLDTGFDTARVAEATQKLPSLAKEQTGTGPNYLFKKGCEVLDGGNIDWLGERISVALVDTDRATIDPDQDTYLADILPTVVATAELTNKTIVDGAADADDVTFPAVTGDKVDALVAFQHGSRPENSPLMLIINNAPGFPLYPNGGDIFIAWSNGPSRIFKIA